LIEPAIRQKRTRNNGQEYLTFWKTSALSEGSHWRFLEHGWCAHVSPSESGYAVELTPLKSVPCDAPCYHATHSLLLASIQQKGLLRVTAGAVSLRNIFPGAKYFIHVSTCITDAIKWATFPHLLKFSDPIYLRVDLHGLNGRIFVDPSASTALLINTDCIPWRNLRRLTRQDVEDILWDEMGGWLSFHKKSSETNGTDVLNRVFRQFVQDAPLFTRDRCRISLVPLFSCDLQRMSRQDYTSGEPRRDDVPLAIVRWNAHDYVVDGRKRANRHIRKLQEVANEPDIEERPLSAIIVERKDDNGTTTRR
jgi:hypothetical protein